MADQTENRIPPPEERDNVFLQIAFSDRPESEKISAIAALKTEAMAALLDPDRHFDSGRENLIQQLEYAKGYISGATQCTQAEEEAFMKKLGDDNLLFLVTLSNTADKKALDLFRPRLAAGTTFPQGSAEQFAFERRRNEFEFLMGYLEGRRILKNALQNGFTARVEAEPAKPQLALQRPLAERGPRAQDFIHQLRI